MFKFILNGYSINKIQLSVASAENLFNLISIILYLVILWKCLKVENIDNKNSKSIIK